MTSHDRSGPLRTIQENSRSLRTRQGLSGPLQYLSVTPKDLSGPIRTSQDVSGHLRRSQELSGALKDLPGTRMTSHDL